MCALFFFVCLWFGDLGVYFLLLVVDGHCILRLFVVVFGVGCCLQVCGLEEWVPGMGICFILSVCYGVLVFTLAVWGFICILGLRRSCCWVDWGFLGF